MGKLFRIDDCRDMAHVGCLSVWLAHCKRLGLPVVDGFVVPVGCKLRDGVGNELLRKFEQHAAPRAVLRTAPSTNDHYAETLRDVGTDRLIEMVSYLQNNAARRGKKAAIVIQRQLQAELVGVAYSLNPITRDSGEFMINAELSAEHVVFDGKSDMDTVLVDKRSGALALSDHGGAADYLGAREVQILTRYVRQAERAMEAAISLDWALVRNRLYILSIDVLDWQKLEEFN